MIGLAATQSRRRTPAFVAFAACLAVAAALGMMSVGLGAWALAGAAVVLMIGLAAVDLTLIPVLVVPATLVQARVGGLLAWSDVVLAAGALVALIMIRGRGGLALQPLIWCGLSYLVVITPTLLLDRFASNYIEWAHEVFLVIGSLIVGFVIAREGKAPAAFGIYVFACGVIGIAAAVVAVRTHFQPVYLPGLNKNTIGGMLAAALVIAYARPPWLHFSSRFANLMVGCCAIGLLASQSRQGLIGGLVGVVVVTLRSPHAGLWARRAIWLTGIPVLILVWQQLSSQLASDNQFNSAYQRLTWFAQSIAVWRDSPIFGVGLRWWYTADYGVNFQPPNAEFEMLTCVGVVGLLAFLAMFASACWVLARMNPIYGTIGLAVVITRLTQTQFDLYWVAGQASLLWIVAGASVGAMVRDRASAAELSTRPVKLEALLPRRRAELRR